MNRQSPPPPPPPQDGLPHVEPPEATSEPPKKRPWSKPTIRTADGLMYVDSGSDPDPYSESSAYTLVSA